MGFISGLVSEGNLIQYVEVLTILAVLVLLGYCFYCLGINPFKKE